MRYNLPFSTFRCTGKFPIDNGFEWRVAGFLHRENGPAIEYSNGDKFWLIKGKLHREDGPAIESANGDEWYLNGKKVSPKRYLDSEWAG